MTEKTKDIIGLVGDVGGTHARYAVAELSGDHIKIRDAKVLLAADYPTADKALTAYLSGLDKADKPKRAVIAAAGPVEKGAVSFTNNDGWRLSETALTKSAGLDTVRLINDFTAQALALEHLTPKMLHQLGPQSSAKGMGGRTDGARVVMGPGTGFGAAALIHGAQGRATVTGEGGHSNFAPGDDVERDIASRLAKRYDHVSVERVLSGPGLLNLYQTLAEIEAKPAPLTDPAEITKAALAGEGLPRLSLARFCAILGSVAGDFALAFGARGGVYISGGIAPGILPVLEASAFRARFEDKDRMSDFLRPIPTRVVLEPHAALIGAATLLRGLKA